MAAAPTGVTVTGGANQAAVAWTAPTNTGGSPITGYVVTPQVKTTPNITLRTPFFGGASATSATVPNLSAGTYSFTVAAITTYGVGGASTASATATVTGTTYPYATTVLQQWAGWLLAAG